jgi:hypothetical protein
MAAAKRMYNYIVFYSSVFFGCLRQRPSILLAYETLSFFPAWLYKKCSSAKPAIMIHYHEYMTHQEVNTGMKLNKWVHRLEEKSYPETVWISHTNQDRMQQFLKDHPRISIPHTYILPNYPSAKWKSKPVADITRPVKIIYVGALSLDTMFTKEFSQWVITQNGKVCWDIYSNNLSTDVVNYFNELNTSWIQFKGACEYAKLPLLLPDYNVGIILYKGHIPNYVYNAPNKLFEYLACGLDVWYPDLMVGCRPFQTNGTWPKVVALDFNRLHIDVETLIDRTGLEHKQPSYFYQQVLPVMVKRIEEVFENARL